MAAKGLIHQFATVLLDSATRKGVDVSTVTGGRMLAEGEKWQDRELLRFLENLAPAMADEFYGLAPSICPLGTLPAELECLVKARSLGEAIVAGCAFLASRTSGLRFNFTHDDARATLEIIAGGPLPTGGAYLVEWHAARWHMLSQWLIGEEIPLDRVDFIHPMHAVPEEYHEVFGDICHFGQRWNRLAFPSRYLDRKLIDRSANLQIGWDAQSYDLLPATNHSHAMHDLLKEQIKSRVRQMEPAPTMNELADELGISSQTLRRRLRSERSSYRDLKAEARREIVIESVRDDKLTLGQISLMAGFAETNGLVRAMKSWTGLTPSQFRRTATDS